MKANELRIGNLVHFCNQKQIHEVSHIDCHFSNEICCKDTVERDFSDFSGIELTEDLLLRFGFELKTIGDGGKEWNYISKYHFSMNNRRGYWSHSPIFLDETAPIKYVHELQNLFFALTKKELILK